MMMDDDDGDPDSGGDDGDGAGWWMDTGHDGKVLQEVHNFAFHLPVRQWQGLELSMLRINYGWGVVEFCLSVSFSLSLCSPRRIDPILSVYTSPVYWAVRNRMEK